MSECVVWMEMPENCCECQLRQEDYEMGEEFCPFTGVECLSIGRQNNCPIICQLPEGHGRLVDADALLDHIVHNYCDDCDDYDGLRCRACPHDDDVQCIEDAPTIVPAAERSET